MPFHGGGTLAAEPLAGRAGRPAPPGLFESPAGGAPVLPQLPSLEALRAGVHPRNASSPYGFGSRAVTAPSSERPRSGGRPFPAPPGTSQSSRSASSRAKRNHDEPISEALKAVQAWWSPVEASARLRRPRDLEVALRDVHGAQYLRTVRIVRRSASLSAEDRHALEMEMSSRLVRARALLGKWKAGLQEVRTARSKRSMEDLEAALAKWSFAEDDPDVATAKEDLQRWQSIASTLPHLLREAVENRDVAIIRETIDQLNSSGPAVVEGSEHAQKMLGRYTLQARALDDAVASGNHGRIQIALQTWEFGRGDPHAQEARNALQKRQSQKAALRAAVQSLDGEQLQDAVRAWGFEKSDEDFAAASEMLQRYKQAAAELERLARPPADLVALEAAIGAWEFAEGAAPVQAAHARFEEHEADARNALLTADGWALHRVWNSGNQGKALAGRNSLLHTEVSEQLQSYSAAVSKLRSILRSANASSTSVALISEQVAGWAYSDADPHMEAARVWLRLQATMEAHRLEALRAADASGHVAAVRGALQRTQGMREDRKEVRQAKAICTAFEAAVEAAGELALGANPGELKVVRERFMVLSAAEQRIQDALALVDARWFAEVKATPKAPHRVVLGVLQMVMFVVAGQCPNVRDPPRDLDWRSCQRMALNVQQLLGHLAFVPARLSSGCKEGVFKAREHGLTLRQELGSQWCVDGVRARSQQAAHLLEYLERVFAYADALEEAMEQDTSTSMGSDSESEGPESPKHDVHQPEPGKAEQIPKRRQSFHIRAVAPPASLLAGPPAAGGRGHRRRSTRLVWRSQSLPSSLDTLAAEMPWLGKRVAAKATLDLDQPAPLVKILYKARRSLGGSAILAAAWMVAGGASKDLDGCVERARRHACSSWGKACVAQQVLAAAALQTEPASPCIPPCGGESEDTTPSEPHPGPQSLALTVKLLNGEVVARVAMAEDATVAELKAALAEAEGTAPRHQRLFYGLTTLDDQQTLGGQGIGQGASITLIRVSGTLSQALEKATSSASACGPKDLDVLGPGGVAPAEPAAYLLFGVGGDSLAERPRPGQPHGAMLQALRAASDVLRQAAASSTLSPRPPPEPPKPSTRGGRRPRPAAPPAPAWALRLCADSVTLDEAAVRSLKIPQVNLSAAWRSLATCGGDGAGARAAADFVAAMQRFYSDFVPQRALAASALAAAEEAQMALNCTEEAYLLAQSLMPLDRVPHCRSVDDVENATAHAAEQVESMARVGLALPAMHVEYVRQAVDSAGSELLDHPPMPDPGHRLQWTEEAVSTQLAPLPRLGAALASIARSVHAQQLEELALGPPPELDGQRLLAAVVWAVEPSCASEAPWERSQRLLIEGGSGEAFAERLASWEPLRDAAPARLARARELLLVIWGWVAAGCGGKPVLVALFSWVSLTVALSPLAEQAQRLQAVNIAVKKGIARVERSPPEKKEDAKAKAWTNVLFVIDSPDRAVKDWWWLGLIRPLAIKDPPWPTNEGPDADDTVIRQPGPASWRRGSVTDAVKDEDDESSQDNPGESPFGLRPFRDDVDDRFSGGNIGVTTCSSIPSMDFFTSERMQGHSPSNHSHGSGLDSRPSSILEEAAAPEEVKNA